MLQPRLRLWATWTATAPQRATARLTARSRLPLQLILSERQHNITMRSISRGPPSFSLQRLFFCSSGWGFPFCLSFLVHSDLPPLELPVKIFFLLGVFFSSLSGCDQNFSRTTKKHDARPSDSSFENEMKNVYTTTPETAATARAQYEGRARKGAFSRGQVGDATASIVGRQRDNTCWLA